jgi:hypothetical protein
MIGGAVPDNTEPSFTHMNTSNPILDYPTLEFVFSLFYPFSFTLPHTMGYLLITGFFSIMITFIGTGASYMESP